MCGSVSSAPQTAEWWASPSLPSTFVVQLLVYLRFLDLHKNFCLLLCLHISDNNIRGPIPNQVAKVTPLPYNALDTPTPNNPHPCGNTHKDQNTNPSRKPTTNEPPSVSATATASNRLRATTSRFKPTNRFEQRVGNGRAPPNNEPPSASAPPNSCRQTVVNRLTSTKVATLG
ncbi:hypothetical protein V8G54_014253 [Vigna mungo]|uniref:Uncharacterized protein n=1 Tax=Vigna mungo TaxID=3915 RepID=A0AAQ3RYF1_VIGMU